MACPMTPPNKIQKPHEEVNSSVEEILGDIYRQNEHVKVSFRLHFIPNSRVRRNYASDLPIMRANMFCSLSMKEAKALTALLSHFPMDVAFAFRIMRNTVQIRKIVAGHPRYLRSWKSDTVPPATLSVTYDDLIDDKLAKFYEFNPSGLEKLPKTQVLRACCEGGNFRFLEHFLSAQAEDKQFKLYQDWQDSISISKAPANLLELILSPKHITKFETNTLMGAIASSISAGLQGVDAWSLEDSFHKLEVIQDLLKRSQEQWFQIPEACRDAFNSSIVSGLVSAAQSKMDSSRFDFFLKVIRLEGIKIDQESHVLPLWVSKVAVHNAELLKYLLNGGLVLGSRFRTEDPNGQTDFYQTLLEISLTRSEGGLAEFLLAHPNYKIDVTVETALRQCDECSDSITQLLLDHGVSPAGRSPCSRGEDAEYPTALHLLVAQSYLHFEVDEANQFQKLLEKCSIADLRQENAYGKTPLHIAVQHNNLRAVEMLTRVDPELRDDIFEVPCTNPEVWRALWKTRNVDGPHFPKPHGMTWVEYQRRGLLWILDKKATKGGKFERYLDQLLEYYLEEDYFQDAAIFSPEIIQYFSSSVKPSGGSGFAGSLPKVCLLLLWMQHFEKGTSSSNKLSLGWKDARIMQCFQDFANDPWNLKRVNGSGVATSLLLVSASQNIFVKLSSEYYDRTDPEFYWDSEYNPCTEEGDEETSSMESGEEEDDTQSDSGDAVSDEAESTTGYISSMEEEEEETSSLVESGEEEDDARSDSDEAEFTSFENFDVSRCFSPLSYAIEKGTENFVQSICRGSFAEYAPATGSSDTPELLRELYRKSLSQIEISDENRRRVVNYDGPGDRNGMTPLKRAIRQGNSQVVALLLQAGADPNLNDPLSYAIRTMKDPRKIELLLTVLLAAGAVPSARVLIDAVECWDSETSRVILQTIGNFLPETNWDAQLTTSEVEEVEEYKVLVS